ncbi:hypothetical protein FGB62_94g067 [Gracilaria domingensis]|nr:hypothetical protein FGB62_94g067 [Gracilaria domingensis]
MSSSPYPAHIDVPVQYTPTAELEHSKLNKLYELSMPAIEDLSWEDVVTNSFAKLREYSKVYGARAEGLRLPRNRAEIEIFFTALLHARYTAAPSASKPVPLKNREQAFDDRGRIHPDVRELALANGLAFHLSQRYGIDTIASVVQFASEKGGKWTDESNALSAALIMEEMANAADREVNGGQHGGHEDWSGALDCLRNSDPWQGWCGFKSGVHFK